MKLVQCLALVALITVIVSTSINCIQGQQPQPFPGATPTPAPEPLPSSKLTWDQKVSIYSTAIADPYVKERILKTGWRNVRRVGDQLFENVSYMMGDVTYMTCREIGPGFDRTRVLPAAEIIPGNASQAGVNVIAFVDTSTERVACIGYVPRPGVPISKVTFTSVDAGVDEYDATWDSHRYYNNATVIDTGYVKGMNLSTEQVDRATALAMTNGTVRGYIGDHRANMRDTGVYSYETGYPYRYIIAYPMVTIDVTDGVTKYDTIYVLADLVNNRVVRVEHGDLFLF